MSRVEVVAELVVGFNSKDEVGFLEWVMKNGGDCGLVLRSEVTTQVAEDVGLVKHNRELNFAGGRIVDLESGLKLGEVCQGEEEKRWMNLVESGLSKGKKVLHVRPKRYVGEVDCFDLWRERNGKVKWIRMEVDSGSEVFLTDRPMKLNEVSLEPMATEMRLVEVLSMFELAKERSALTFKMITEVFDRLFYRFKEKYGDDLFKDSEKIQRLYSAVHAELGQRQDEMTCRRQWGEGLETRTEMYFGASMQPRQIKSFGCAGSTMVGMFKEGEGYYVTGAGKVIKGGIPGGYVLCEKCGVYHKANIKCPFCLQ